MRPMVGSPGEVRAHNREGAEFFDLVRTEGPRAPAAEPPPRLKLEAWGGEAAIKSGASGYNYSGEIHLVR
jgi:hypothetical protein